MKNQSTIILKVTFLNQIWAIFPFVFIVSCPIVTLLYLFHQDGKNLSDIPSISLKLTVVLALILAYFAIITLPTLFFHIDYLIRNWKEEYKIGNGKIIKRKKGVEKVYYFEEIKDVCLYLSPPLFRKDIPFWAYDNYHYARIIMKSGEDIYLTNLLSRSGGIEKILKCYMKNTSYKRERRRFPTTLCK